MTPRQINAFQFIAGRRLEREMALELSVAATAQSGDSDAINKLIDKWEGDQ